MGGLGQFDIPVLSLNHFRMLAICSWIANKTQRWRRPPFSKTIHLASNFVPSFSDRHPDTPLS